MNDLQKRLSRQVITSGIMLGLGILNFILYIVTLVFLISHEDDLNNNYYYDNSLPTGLIVLIVFVVIVSLAYLILLIVGIVNAAKINTLTNGENVILIVFSIFTLVIANLITAVMAKNKYKNYDGNSIVYGQGRTKNFGTTSSKDAKLNSLKKAFVDGVITSKEYEAKEAKLKKED